jgi:hypothetical protein
MHFYDSKAPEDISSEFACFEYPQVILVPSPTLRGKCGDNVLKDAKTAPPSVPMLSCARVDYKTYCHCMFGELSF